MHRLGHSSDTHLESCQFSVDDFESVRTTAWEGVRNHEAKNLMKEMKLGDKVNVRSGIYSTVFRRTLKLPSRSSSTIQIVNFQVSTLNRHVCVKARTTLLYIQVSRRLQR